MNPGKLIGFGIIILVLVLAGSQSTYVVDPGFRGEHVITTTVVLPSTTYSAGEKQIEFFHRLEQRLRQQPGVQSVGTITRMPLDFGNSTTFAVVGQPTPEPGQFPSASYRQTSADYFTAMGIPVLKGRVFGAGDDMSAPEVAVVNRTLVKAYFGDQDPIGQRITTGRDTLRVVGVGGDVPIGNIGDRIPPTGGACSSACRTRGSPRTSPPCSRGSCA